jgi:hypothetical protein
MTGNRLPARAARHSDSLFLHAAAFLLLIPFVPGSEAHSVDPTVHFQPLGRFFGRKERNRVDLSGRGYLSAQVCETIYE